MSEYKSLSLKNIVLHLNQQPQRDFTTHCIPQHRLYLYRRVKSVNHACPFSQRNLLINFPCTQLQCKSTPMIGRIPKPRQLRTSILVKFGQLSKAMLRLTFLQVHKIAEPNKVPLWLQRQYWVHVMGINPTWQLNSSYVNIINRLNSWG